MAPGFPHTRNSRCWWFTDWQGKAIQKPRFQWWLKTSGSTKSWLNPLFSIPAKWSPDTSHTVLMSGSWLSPLNFGKLLTDYWKDLSYLHWGRILHLLATILGPPPRVSCQPFRYSKAWDPLSLEIICLLPRHLHVLYLSLPIWHGFSDDNRGIYFSSKAYYEPCIPGTKCISINFPPTLEVGLNPRTELRTLRLMEKQFGSEESWKAWSHICIWDF